MIGTEDGGLFQNTIKRLSRPYGTCVSAPPSGYLYPGKYTTEASIRRRGGRPRRNNQRGLHAQGCQRSCYQRFVVEECSCADPRYPIPKDTRACTVNESRSRTKSRRSDPYVGSQRSAWTT